MPAANFKLAVATAAILSLFVCAQARFSQSSARDFLAKSLSRESPVNVVAIVCQCDKKKSSDEMMFQVTISKDGKQRKEVLEPIHLQGYLSVDDGNRLKVYMPDDRTLLDQESSQAGPREQRYRLKLIAKNYRLRVYKPRKGETPKVADKPVVIITAEPIADGLPSKRFYIDKKTYFVLRIESQMDNDAPVIEYETKYVKYPDDLPSDTFKMRPLVGITKMRYERRRDLPHGDAAVREVGFEPIVPARLAAGFVVQDAQINNSSDWKSVVLRITDGIQIATVYEWKPLRSESEDHGVSRDMGGVRVLIKADFPNNVVERLLDAFEAAADRSAPTAIIAPQHRRSAPSTRRIDDHSEIGAGPMVPNATGVEQPQELRTAVRAFPSLVGARSAIRRSVNSRIASNGIARRPRIC